MEEEEMEKIITISGKDYKMKASALTQFSYKNETGRSFLTDLQALTKLKDTTDINAIDDVSELVLRMAYIMAKEADKSQATNYESFLSGIDDLFSNTDWLQQVLELACSPLSRQLQTNQNKIK